jgi:hypothetical protein
MKVKTFSLFLSSLVLALTAGHGASALAASVSSSVVTSSVSGGSSTVEAVVTGPNAVIAVNGDRVEIKDGRLSVNGVAYGTVGEQSTVTYRVEGKVRTLLVDGVERRPEG